MRLNHKSEIALLACFVLLTSCNSNPSTTTKSDSATQSYVVPDQIELTASASRDAIGGTVIRGTTNLPDGTRLGIELMDGKRAGAQDYHVVVGSPGLDSSGQFHSAGFRNGTSPLPPGKQKVHVLTYFNGSWQSPTILNLLGPGGNKLKPSALIHSEDEQLIDGDKVLDYTVELIVPPLTSVAAKVASPESSPREATAIQLVKKAVLTVDGKRSSMNVEDGVQFYFTAPGVRPGNGWSAKQTNDTLEVSLDFLDGGNHASAIWEVNVATKKVLYRNKFAKHFSYIPDN